MNAVILNCTLKASPAESNTGALASILKDELEKHGTPTEIIRLADFNIAPGVSSDEGRGDDWPPIRQKIVGATILVMASPTWLGRISSVAQRALERMDAMLSESDSEGQPVAFNHVAGCVATGNEDGAKHVIGELEAALIEIGFTIPGQSWTYWNNGAAIGDSYIHSNDEQGKKRATQNARLAAHVLTSTAKALSS